MDRRARVGRTRCFMNDCPVCDREFDEGERCPDDGTVLILPREAEPDPLIGDILKETYRVGAKLGEGGMGASIALFAQDGE